MPSVRAAAWMASHSGAMAKFPESHRTATRFTPGMASFSSCRRFAPSSGAKCDIPVTLPPGRAKLAINLILGINRAALAEGLVFAERMGLAPEAFLKVARESAAYSQIMDIKGAKMLKGDFSPQGYATQTLKDFSLMLELARRLKQQLPLGETYAGLMKGCVAAGEGALDNSAVIKEIRRRAT